MENNILTKNEQDDNNVIPFERPKLKLNTGDPNDPVWLNNLGVGSIFYARKRNSQDFMCPCFVLYAKTEKTCILLEQSSGDKELPVVPQRFCREWEMHELLRDHEMYLAELEMNKNHEQGNSSIESSVEDTEGAKD